MRWWEAALLAPLALCAGLIWGLHAGIALHRWGWLP